VGVQGQQIQQMAEHRAGAAYDVARESVISGKIAQYSSASTTPPFGAHISLQSGSGTVEVHAGNAKLIQASDISCTPRMFGSLRVKVPSQPDGGEG